MAVAVHRGRGGGGGVGYSIACTGHVGAELSAARHSSVSCKTTDTVLYDRPAIFEKARASIAPSVVADFADSIDHAVSQLLDNRFLAQETERPGVRRWYLRRFRYSIFFTIEGDELVIRHAARR